MEKNTDTPAENADILKISSIPSKLEITLGSENFQLVQNNNQWTCREYDGLKLSYSKIAFMIETLRSLEAERILQNSAAVKKYGLEKPSAIIKACTGSRVQTYYIGDYNSILNEYYVKTDDSDDIFLVRAENIRLLNRSLRQLVDVPEITRLQTNEITEITAEQGKKYSMERVQSGFLAKYDGRTTLISDYKAMKVYAAINSATYDCQVYDASENMKKSYGFDHPAATIKVKIQNGDVHTLKLAESKGQYYANENDTAVIYQIDENYYSEILKRTRFEGLEEQ